MLMKGPPRPEKSWWDENGGLVILGFVCLGAVVVSLLMRIVAPR